MMTGLISVVVSFRNEQEVLEELVDRLEAFFTKLAADYELVFVNDDSSDRSQEVLLAARQRNPRIKIATTSRRFGFYACMMAGFRLASGDCAIYLDSDLQDPPELIPDMVAAWKNGADIVHMQRLRRIGESRLHRAIVHLAYVTISRISSIEIPPDIGDFKLYSRRALDQLCSMRESYPYVRGLAAWVGFNQVILNYDRAPRRHGASKRSGLSRAALRVFVNAIIGFSSAPIQALGLLGLAGLFGSLVWLVSNLAAIGTAYDDGALALIAPTILFSLAVTLLSNFVLGVYVYRIWHEVLKRPPVIIRDRIGFDANRSQ